MTDPLDDLTETVFDPVGTIRVTTERTTWTLRAGPPGWYHRQPAHLDDAGRPPDLSYRGRLDDGIWVPYRTVAWYPDPHTGTWRLHVHPVPAPPVSAGVYSGPIVTIDGTWEPSTTTVATAGGEWLPLRDIDGRPDQWLRVTDLEPWLDGRSEWRAYLYQDGRQGNTWQVYHDRNEGSAVLIEAAMRALRAGPTDGTE